MREAELGRAIGHDNVVRTYECDQVFVDGAARAFLVMEYVEGKNLRHRRASTHLAPGLMHTVDGDRESGRDSLVAVRDLAAKNGFAGVEVLARCHLARLPGGDAQNALAALAANRERLDPEELHAARFRLFRATGDRAHLADAKHLLDAAMANIDDETRVDAHERPCQPRDHGSLV